MWTINATIESEKAGTAGVWRGVRQVPTFYLSEHVQGVSTVRHAIEVARQIIDPLGIMDPAGIHVTASKIEG